MPRFPILPVLIAAVICHTGLAAGEAKMNEFPFEPTKDVRVSFDPAETAHNGGGCTVLRVRAAKEAAAECILMDFDHKALATVIEKNAKTKGMTIKLQLVLRGMVSLQKATIEAALLETPSEWLEGDKNFQMAVKGEVTPMAPAYQVDKWLNTKGKPVYDLRELFYDKISNGLLSMGNSKTVDVDPSQIEKTIELELDPKFAYNLVKNPASKGLILFTRSGDFNTAVDFYSKEQNGKPPKLVVSVPAK